MTSPRVGSSLQSVPLSHVGRVYTFVAETVTLHNLKYKL